MRVRKDQKGFTIVELLIAVAILSIVVASVCGFILVGSRSYAAANSDINVQQSAQLALNQMSDVLIDTTRSVNYGGFDKNGVFQMALKDAEFTFTPEDKSLVMFNGMVEENVSPGGTATVEVKEGNGNKHYQFYWSKDDEKLYYTELNIDPANDVDTKSIHFPAFDPTNPDWVELAAHVTDFSVDLTQVEEKRVVMLALTFLDGKKEYVTSNNVTIRNKVGVNDAALEKLDKKKTLAVKIMDKPIVEPGETFHFSVPKVTGNNVADKSVTWSVTVSGSPTNGTTFTDPANGILKVAQDEPAGSVKVTVTTNAKDSEGNQASDTAEVAIKRVTNLNLSTDAPKDATDNVYMVEPGGTYTVFADVTGNRLEEVCSVCAEDTTIDKQVISEKSAIIKPEKWRVYNPSAEEGSDTNWNPTTYVTIIDSAPDHTTFTVATGAPTSTDDVDYGFVVQGISLLSAHENSFGRKYGWVAEGISFRIVKGKGNIQLNGSLHWGASTEFGYDTGEVGYNHYYVICARIREYGTQGGDKIMIYMTEGKSARVTPDMFGVEDVSKPWHLSLQVLNPMKDIPPGVGLSNQLTGDLGAQISDPTVLDIIGDYLNNCDASGTYVGTKYPHTGKLETIINPPEIFYEYDGQKNLGGELKLKSVSALAGPAWTEFAVDYVKNTRDETLGKWFANDNIKFSMYKEKKDGSLEKIYWYNSGGNYYEGNDRPFGGALELNEIQKATGVKIKLDYNRRDKFSEAAGKYRLIPTIIYEQGSWADHVGGASIYYVNYYPKYKTKQCYEDKKSTVYYELVNGGNVDPFWSYYNNRFTKGEIYFPAPSEAGFIEYFDREKTYWQDEKKLNYFSKTIDGESNVTQYQASSMRCRYVADSKVYELELFYQYTDSSWNRNMEISAGVFQCPADGNRWEQKKAGPYDSQIARGEKPDPSTMNVDFEMNGSYYKGRAYLPLPSEKAFVEYLGFELKKDGVWQTKDYVSLKFRKDGEQGLSDLQIVQLKCCYDAKKDEYTIQVWDRNGGWRGAYLCKSDENQWRKY